MLGDGHGWARGLGGPTRRWVDEHACKLFRRTPGVVLGLGFCALLYGLMMLMQGNPRAFIYFQF